MRSTYNTLLLLVCLLVIGGAGYYLTEVRQPEELQKIDDTIQLAKMEQAAVSDLLVQQASSKEKAEASLAQWRSRYKEIPSELNTADMVLYLESLTRTGFERFDIDLVGRTNKSEFSYYTFKVDALSTFAQMYRFVWHIENNRAFYRINNLKISHETIYKENTDTQLPKRYDMVQFSFTLDAYFNAKNGIAAGEEELMEVPDDLLPRSSARHDSFHPLVRTDLPPNDEQLLDIEKATLVSIVGNRAIFESGDYSYIVTEGDRIYLGEVLNVDPRTATVRVQQNKGGKTYTTLLSLDVEMMDVLKNSNIMAQPTTSDQQ